MADKLERIGYVTKYALSSGIEEFHLLWGDLYAHTKGTYSQLFRIGRDVFETREDAMIDAEKRRDRKIKSLKAQLAKLEKLTFVAK